ncbi:MAG TPA: sulfite exporter TauE/SafE family protein, partial [Chitinophagaceae bacterium]|nr:sulfite exporter TauE/SafE family protein [Chitinophagaceae bacterium]
GIPSFFSIFIPRHYILPALPDQLFAIGDFTVTTDIFLMILFAVLMLGASISMIVNRNDNRVKVPMAGERQNKALPLILLGLGIGLVTGLLGAGGGFLIIPSLVLFLRLPMKIAVGTSLLLVAINSLFGFLFSLKQFEYNWTILLLFTILAISGIFIGSRLADKIPGASLKKGFGWFVLVMGIYIIVKELFFPGR